ncbi:MAG: hypothetical protein ABI551_25950 [Polyangiaceae bacterium]
MLRRSIGLGLFNVLLSCSSASSSGTASKPAGDDGGGSTTLDCAGDAVTTDARCGTLGWSVSATVSRPRNHHLSVVAHTSGGDFLYSIGGADGASTLANVDRAPIAADGGLGDFTELTPIPRATGGMTGGVVSNVIVLAGGTHGNAVTNQAYSAVIQDDGSLGAWTSAGSVGNFRMHPGSIVNGSDIYVLGGFNDPSVWSDIVKATVSADGTVSAWTPAGTLAGPLSHFSATLHDGYVYVAGGLDKSAFQSPPPLATVTRGHLLADGTIGEWTAMPSLPKGVCTHAAFFYGGYLYVGGGLSGPLYAETKTVWRAAVGADHMLGAWEETASLATARGHVHQFPVFGNHVYSIAGAITLDLKSTTTIEVGTFE